MSKPLEVPKPDIFKVFDRYGIGYRGSRANGWNPAHCPSPAHDDSNMSCSVTAEYGGRFNCHGCGEKGDGIDVISLQEGCDMKTAFAIARDLDGTSITRSNGPSKQKPFALQVQQLFR